jgi:AraC-like DNA-binding protein
MKYLVSENNKPLIHVSSGQLQNEGGFIHPKRNLDTHVIIVCIKGKLHIAQGERRLTLLENQFCILFAGQEHYGYKESENALAYYWCHFRFSDDWRLVNEKNLFQFFDTTSMDFTPRADRTEKQVSEYYFLPEYGAIAPDGRAILMFRQLLDMGRSISYTRMIPNAALSLLALEITQELIAMHFNKTKKNFNPKMEKIIEWIRVNYNVKIDLDTIAQIFTYNPDYLSTTFHKYTGYPLMKYIAMVQISNAKKLLLNSSDSIKEIAYKVGFDDEKAFMKRFKQLEDITPTTFRNAFSRTKIVKQ